MKSAFEYASVFDGDIANWGTSNVLNMYMIFHGADALKDKETTIFNTWNIENAKKSQKTILNNSLIIKISSFKLFDQNQRNFPILNSQQMVY